MVKCGIRKRLCTLSSHLNVTISLQVHMEEFIHPRTQAWLGLNNWLIKHATFCPIWNNNNESRNNFKRVSKPTGGIKMHQKVK